MIAMSILICKGIVGGFKQERHAAADISIQLCIFTRYYDYLCIAILF